MKQELTPRETDVLKYIIQFKQTNGYSPTAREIAKGVNTSSLQHINSILNNLSEKGYLTFKEKKPRTIKVIKFIA